MCRYARSVSRSIVRCPYAPRYGWTATGTPARVTRNSSGSATPTRNAPSEETVTPATGDGPVGTDGPAGEADARADGAGATGGDGGTAPPRTTALFRPAAST